MVHYKWNKIRLMFSSIFLLVFIAMLCGLALMLSDWYAHKDTYVSVQATITAIEAERRGSKTGHTVTVTYEFEGEHYERGLGYYNSGMRRGDAVEILLDPENPREIITSPWEAASIFGILAAIMGGIGVGVFAFELRKRSFAMRMIRSGQYVTAKFDREEFANVRVNGVCYHRAIFIYIDPSDIWYEFASEAYHPLKHPYSDGRPVRVYVDIKNPKRYYITADQTDFDAT